jgi:hypothetical protein
MFTFTDMYCTWYGRQGGIKGRNTGRLSIIVCNGDNWAGILEFSVEVGWPVRKSIPTLSSLFS